MAIIRVQKNENFTIVSNAALRDNRLSLKARGLMVYMLSLPEDWDLSVKGLITCLNEGKDSINGALRELEKAGYLKREQSRCCGGKFSKTEFVLYETPQNEEAPLTEKPLTEKPLPENPQQQRTIYNKELYITNNDDDDINNNNINNKASAAFDAWEENIAPITPVIAENLKDLVDEIGVAAVKKAIEKAALSNKRSWFYIAKVARGIAAGDDWDNRKTADGDLWGNALAAYGGGLSESG